MKGTILSLAPVLLILLACTGKIRNAEEKEVRINGNCEMCEERIENAGNKDGEAQVDWNSDTKIASIVYDRKKTSLDEILQRIASAGHSSVQFPADKNAYGGLPECCKYDKTLNADARYDLASINNSPGKTVSREAEPEPGITESTAKRAEATEEMKASLLDAALKAYYELKDALVVENVKEIHEGAIHFEEEIQKLDVTLIPRNELDLLQKEQKKMEFLARKIGETKNVEVQRENFASLSGRFTNLLRKYPAADKVYVQRCKEKSDYIWLTEDDDQVKNPYFGPDLLSCGETIEKIKSRID